MDVERSRVIAGGIKYMAATSLEAVRPVTAIFQSLIGSSVPVIASNRLIN